VLGTPAAGLDHDRLVYRLGMITRLASSTAAALAMPVGLVAGAGLVITQLPRGLSGYVSEAGVPGSPFATFYQLSVLGIAVTAGLLGYALWPLDRRQPGAWWRDRRSWAAALLAAAAPMVAVSATVSCTEGCPLPPYEPTTLTDLVHAVSSIVGVGCCALAMAAVAWQSAGRLRAVSIVAVLAGWPVMLGTAIGIAAVGRGALTALLERLGLAVCVGWLVAIAAVLRVARQAGRNGS
jgi:hypothetical protein